MYVLLPFAMSYVQTSRSRCKYTSALWTLKEALVIKINHLECVLDVLCAGFPTWKAIF